MSELSPIDAYLAGVTQPEQHAVLQALCTTLRAALPHATECLSYGLPTFKVSGKSIVSFGANAKHCSYYPCSGGIVTQFTEELKDFKTSKGAIQFTPERPLPTTLIHCLIQARMEEAGISID
ncbi:MAG: DUF1801 domain-containing protein [Armatimonas sp.]